MSSAILTMRSLRVLISGFSNEPSGLTRRTRTRPGIIQSRAYFLLSKHVGQVKILADFGHLLRDRVFACRLLRNTTTFLYRLLRVDVVRIEREELVRRRAFWNAVVDGLGHHRHHRWHHAGWHSWHSRWHAGHPTHTWHTWHTRHTWHSGHTWHTTHTWAHTHLLHHLHHLTHVRHPAAAKRTHEVPWEVGQWARAT